MRGSPAVTDPRNLSFVVQHSLLLAPEEPMEPRFDDPRVGYFGHQVTDLSSTDVTPYRDVIERWRLEKKDTDAEMSEPLKPIVFWIENTTPVEIRPIIEKAALRWNDAFETAGFINALQVKTQPDDAEWQAGDLRYNVLRWTSSPTPQFGGYGPSFHDPRTGEILGADIMLEHSVISRQSLSSDVMGEGANLDAWKEQNPERCSASFHAHNETLFGLATLEALGADGEEEQRLIEEFLYYLILHEIGHTLGLNHNFRSSYLHTREDLNDPDKTYSLGLYGSVMDYPAVPFAKMGEKQNQYWTTRPGPYDEWAIAFGYTPGLQGEDLEAHLAKSTQPELAFANDADDMRAPGKAIDPRAMIYDISSDPIGFSLDQIELIKAVQPRFKDRLLKEGASYQYLLNGYNLSLRRYGNAFETVSRFIGGVYIDRAVVGQKDGAEPLTPVDAVDQRRAMDVLSDKLFAADAFDAFDDVARQLLPQRRGFDHYETTEDPKLHANALGIQKEILDHLLHSRVLARVTDSTLYGNQYSVDQVFTDLTQAIFEADLNTSVNTIRQNLQLEYVDRLVGIVSDGGYDRISRSMALNRLRWIEVNVAPRRADDLQTRAHREHVLYRIKSGLDPK
ncbi:zinc-dependent metalloprotease [Pelagicoccus sp. SDUM812002]|uniref:zinc-dependent metalloprotease n=1 Tax=Pelagicoccus sp. SDUM812002 TaxID=3041266 RepID=UPI00280DE807|nr:zinc-dependent metalloprotease [Pelagicoccus sp. SDUM812002]MDQ8187413.1 zinc-dependent metalloprotease [Pelagicoccus sp. SDUM812002]